MSWRRQEQQSGTARQNHENGYGVTSRLWFWTKTEIRVIGLYSAFNVSNEYSLVAHKLFRALVDRWPNCILNVNKLMLHGSRLLTVNISFVRWWPLHLCCVVCSLVGTWYPSRFHWELPRDESWWFILSDYVCLLCHSQWTAGVWWETFTKFHVCCVPWLVFVIKVVHLPVERISLFVRPALPLFFSCRSSFSLK